MSHTLREEIAMRVMASVMQTAVLPTQKDRDEALPLVAKICCECADALIAALQAADQPSGTEK